MTRFDLHVPARGLCAAVTAAVMGAVLFATPAEAARTSLLDLLNRIAALEAQNAAQQNQIAELQADLAQEKADRQAADDALQDLIDALPGDSLPAIRAAVDALQADVADLQADSVPGLADHVSVIELLRDLDGFGPEPVRTIWVEGANVQIVDGSGTTFPAAGRPSGRGNLIVGYDEAPQFGVPFCSDGQFSTQVACEGAGEIWDFNQKNGAHNLVVGPVHSYTQAGGVVFGEANLINALAAVVSGGTGNTAGGRDSSVSGGRDNTASGTYSSVSGGEDNTASGTYSSVSGGRINTASGDRSSVSGGLFNIASGFASSVSGGQANTASGGGSSVSGGVRNTASATNSSVSGGRERSAPDAFDWAAGSLFEPF